VGQSRSLMAAWSRSDDRESLGLGYERAPQPGTATRKPELSPSDVARLVEVIADRHFLALTTPAFSEIAELHPEAR
jgi:hypothetical protein